METINVLIVASSDMDGSDDHHNLPNDVSNITYPCHNYNGKLLKTEEPTTFESPRCSQCHYTEVEHKYGYPLFPLHPVKLKVGSWSKTMGKRAGKPVYSNSQFSDLWVNKTPIFERIKFIYGDTININYHTITETYKNDLTYLPTIHKINTIVEKNIKLKGKITYQEPYHFSCMLDKIYNQEGYKNTLYDCIFVVSGGLGWLYTPENFKIMSKLLKKDSTIPRVIGNVFYTPSILLPEYEDKMTFMNPITSVLKDRDVLLYSKQDVNKCIRNYSNILLGNTFVEAYDMLFRNTKPKTKTSTKTSTKTQLKTKKNSKHKSHKRIKTKI
jgi:hypothetical protein